MITPEIPKLPKFRRALSKEPQILQRNLKGKMTEVITHMASVSSPYPPKPSISRYRRTGTLGRRWTQKITQQGKVILGRYGNNTAYADDVLGFNQSPLFKEYGWKDPHVRLRENERFIMDRFDGAVRATISEIEREAR